MKDFKNPETKSSSISKKKQNLPLNMANFESSESTDSSPNNRIVQKRKSKDQIYILENEFFKCKVWDREKVESLANMLGLTPLQVYKWRWDFKNKRKINQESKEVAILICKETLKPSFMTLNLFNTRNKYFSEYKQSCTPDSPSIFLNSDTLI